MNSPIVMKFGGTSVEDPNAFERIIGIVSSRQPSQPVIVVSAMSGFTDALLDSVAIARTKDPVVAARSLDRHFDRHVEVAEKLAPGSSEVAAALAEAQRTIAELLQVVAAGHSRLASLQDEIVSYGERLSSFLLATVLNRAGVPACQVDARECVITDEQYGRAEPLADETNTATKKALQTLIDSNQIPVLGGFIASSLKGKTTTLGRGGSDYTAAIVGAALNAVEVQIWTDVPGVLTADPRVIKEATTIPRLSYSEAAELAYFGAKVLHPKTIQPAIERNIPVRICNSRDPEHAGTMVCADTEISPQSVKAIAHKTGITLLQVTSARMLGAHGFLHAIFEIFNRHRTVIDIVTTSEVSVSLSIDDAASLPTILEELRELGSVYVETDRAVVCVVGEGLRGTPGVAARVFGCLGDINVSVISQGASQINLTFVVEEERVVQAISRLHEAFFATDRTVEAVA